MEDTTKLNRTVLEQLGYVRSIHEDMPIYKKKDEVTVYEWANYFTLKWKDTPLYTVGDLKAAIKEANQ